MEITENTSKNDDEVDKMVTDCLNGLAQQKAQYLSGSALKALKNNTNLKSKNKVKKVPLFKGISKKDKFLLDTILEGSEFESEEDDEWNVEDTRNLENALNHTHIPNTRNNKPTQKLSSNTIGPHYLGMGPLNETFGARISVVSREISCKSPVPLSRRKSSLITNGGEIVHTLQSLSKKRDTITSYLENDRKQLINVIANSALSISPTPEYENEKNMKLKRTKTTTSNYQDINSSHSNVVQIKYGERPNGFAKGNRQFNPIFIEQIHSNRRLTVNPDKKGKEMARVVPKVANAFQEGELLSIQESENESIDYNMSVDNEAKWI